MAVFKFSAVVFALCIYAASAQPIPSPGPEETPMASPMASPAAAPEKGNVTRQVPICFPGAATVQLASGARKPMFELAVGDLVQVSATEFSEVFMFTHKMSSVVNDFVTLVTESGAKLSLTSGHYLYVSGSLVAARTVKVGDTVELADGSVSRVTAVAADQLTGLYNPQTVHGDIIVDGVRASTYTTAVAPQFAHAALSPLRAAYERLGFSSKLLDNGARLLASFAPNGESVIA